MPQIIRPVGIGQDKALRQWQNQRRVLLYIVLPAVFVPCAAVVAVVPSGWPLLVVVLLVWVGSFLYSCVEINRASRRTSPPT